MKKNCWEIIECGRELGGAKVKEFGVCPAALETKLDGVHHGKNAGRCCWVVTGTLCLGKAQGERKQKKVACENCVFYHYVKKEEGKNFNLAVPLGLKLQKK